MTVVSVRELTPYLGKEKLVEGRLKRAETIFSKHGAQTRMYKTVVGQGVGDYILMSMYESFSKATKSFDSNNFCTSFIWFWFGLVFVISISFILKN